METRSKLLLAVALSMLLAAGQAPANTDPGPTSHTLPLVLGAGGGATGVVRIASRSETAGTVEIEGLDDAGNRFGPITLALPAGEAVQLTSYHLEAGNAGRGLATGLGNGRGHWRLTLTTDLEIEAGAYVRGRQGLLASMHDVVPEPARGTYRVPVLDPARAQGRTGVLRIASRSDDPTEVVIEGTDDRGQPGEGEVHLTLRPWTARTLTARTLESGGEGVEGRLGDGAGRWRLEVRADGRVTVMSLVQSASGHLTNVSTTAMPEADVAVRFVGCGPPTGFHGHIARGAMEAGADLGVDVTYVYPKVLSAASQVRLVDEAIRARVDAIALCAYLEDDPYRAVAGRARTAGIAIGSAGAPPPGSVRNDPRDIFLFRTGSDERAAGELTARRLLELGVTRGRVAILNHRPSDVTCWHRAQAQAEVLERHKVKVSLVEREMDLRGQAQALLEVMGRHVDVRAATAVCAAPDPLLDVKTLTGRKDLVITGYDLIGESVAAILDGRQAFTIDQQQFWRGYVPVMLLVHHVRYGLRQANHFLTGPTLVDASNVEQVADLVGRGYR